MTQFCVHRDDGNPDGPLLLDLQNDLVESLNTRVVAPLYHVDAVAKQTITDLTPIVEIRGKRYLVMVPRLAAIRSEELGKTVTDLSQYRNEFIAAVDLLITGY